MALTLRSWFLLCGLGLLATGAWCKVVIHEKDNGCPKDWTRLDCYCYILQVEERTFADAESVCNILGGNLASIHSALENSFVHELILAIDDPADAWVGLHDAINQNDDFIWTDGTLEDFRAFNGSEPDNSGDCTQINESDGCWADVACTMELNYVCIRDLLHHW